MVLNSLLYYLQDFKVIATIGICKNAGKTTVLNYLIESLHDLSIIGITSIGYDGEELDIITKLPKPRIRVYEGMMVATSDSCLSHTSIKYERLIDTKIVTAIGTVIIIKVLSEGFIEVAGPSMSSQIKNLTRVMIDLGCDKVFVDGAASRMTYGNYVDCSILSIGAAMSTDMKQVVNATKHIIEMMNLPLATFIDKSVRTSLNLYVKVNLDSSVYYSFRGNMVDKDVIEILKAEKDIKLGNSIKIVVNDSTSIHLSPRIYNKLKKANGQIYVLNKMNLVALTINPMSPYGEWFDEDVFMNEIRKAVTLPVFNIMNEKVDKHEK